MNFNNVKVAGGGKTQRLIGLDFLRIALALLVFFFHSRIHFECSYGIMNNFVQMGAIAMTGFMLLSGYVLYVTYHTRVLIEKVQLKQFYLKRLISILPLYYSIAILHIACGLITGKTSFVKEIVLFPIETLGLQSVFTSLFSYSHNGGTWFISCILICYAVYPLMQSLIELMSAKGKLILLGLLVVILLYSPIVQHLFHLADLYSNPFFRMQEFFIGVILANFACNNRESVSKFSIKTRTMMLTLIIIFLILGVTLAVSIGIPYDFMLYNWIALPSFSVIILILGSMSLQKCQHNKMLNYLSSISFTFFLCQVLPLWGICRRIVEYLNSTNNGLKIIISFAICFVGAILIHEFIEKPSAKILKKKLL